MYSWLWAKFKLCQYRFIMVTRRAQDQVKETLKQPYQTTVSIEWLPCLCIDAASYHEVCQKNATTWGGRVDWNLHFHLLKEFYWNYDVNQKATWQSNIKNHQCKYKALCICIYIYTVFAIAVYLGSTYGGGGQAPPPKKIGLWVAHPCLWDLVLAKCPSIMLLVALFFYKIHMFSIILLRTFYIYLYLIHPDMCKRGDWERPFL